MKTLRLLLIIIVQAACAIVTLADPPRQVFVVPNFHPASCGWLTDWSTERNYCANSYLDHLDRVRDDASYNFALSECNNLIAIANFAPQRFAELKERVQQGRVELANAFFLEPTINLSGGEALVKMGVEGLRWQRQVMGVRPRLSWMIDVCGVHEQMAQIVAGLGLDALVYCRLNPTGSTMHWLESPDGTRTLAVSPGHYLEWRPMFGAKTPLAEKQLLQLADDIRARIEPLPADKDGKRPDAADLKGAPRRTPPGAPVLIFGGSGDYSLAPLCKSYPSEFLQQFKKVAPEFDVKFSTPGRYLDAVLPGIKSGAISLPTMRSGTAFTYNSFWIQNPRVKSSYRQCEQMLQAAEMLATASSLRCKTGYPTQPLYHGWLQMLLNMDRNTLWGAAGGMVFEHERSWDAHDRFESVERLSCETLNRAARALAGEGRGLAVFNPLNWRRTDPFRLAKAAGSACQSLPGGNDVICRLDLPSLGVSSASVATQTIAAHWTTLLPPVIETRYYRAQLDPATGALLSLKLKPSGREMFAGPANVIVAEQPVKKIGNPADHMVERPERQRVADSTQAISKLTVSTGPLATVVEAESVFVGGGTLRRMMIFYKDYPRIDFETELNDIPDRTVIVAEFPLASAVREVRRGVPYGFSHAAWAEPNPALTGVAKGVTPAVRWSHYQMAGAGVALFDIGLTGRELNGNIPVIYLYNASEKYRGYPNAWLSGAGRHVLRYALVAHAGDFATARIPRMAWEFNNPPVVVDGCAPAKATSFVQTSDNVIVEALRREGGEIELRLAECLGRAGRASVTLKLPHLDAALTDLVGGHREPLRGGPNYKFPVRPQQIVTMRFRTETSAPEVRPLMVWDELVPAKKKEALHRYLPEVKGHPPAGGQ
jgi:alpha-mannosidase